MQKVCDALQSPKLSDPLSLRLEELQKQFVQLKRDFMEERSSERELSQRMSAVELRLHKLQFSRPLTPS